MKKYAAIFRLFRAGQMVADPAKWKKRQITTTVLATVIWAILDVGRVYGLDIAISQEVIDGIAIAVLGVVNLVFTVTTTEKIGLPAGDTTSTDKA